MRGTSGGSNRERKKKAWVGGKKTQGKKKEETGKENEKEKK